MEYLYILTAVLWGIFSAKMQKKLHPECGKAVVAGNGLVNALICPISLMFAIIFGYSKAVSVSTAPLVKTGQGNYQQEYHGDSEIIQ